MHTPAPWKYEKSENYRDMAFLRRPSTGSQLIPLEDARLIAAAPDLLAALQALLPHVPVPRVPMGDDPGNPFPLPDYIVQARAALSKALGE